MIIILFISSLPSRMVLTDMKLYIFSSNGVDDCLPFCFPYIIL